jgi:hypothetical protein
VGTFIQIMEYKTSKFDEIQALADKWVAATEGKRTATSGLVTKDRDNRDTYVEIIEFPSYEDAMKNSELPETQEIAAQMAALADGPPTFRNLDVVRDDVI